MSFRILAFLTLSISLSIHLILLWKLEKLVDDIRKFDLVLTEFTHLILVQNVLFFLGIIFVIISFLNKEEFSWLKKISLLVIIIKVLLLIFKTTI